MSNTTGELLMDHWQSPYHRGTLTDASHHAQTVNPLCGDQVLLQLRMSPAGIVEAACFVGQGCIISQGAASLVCEHIEGMGRDALRSWTADELLASIELKLSPIRQRCALLPFEALQEILSADSSEDSQR